MAAVLSMLAPSPAPTVTVTEVVTVAPSPPPTIYVQVPDGWDPVHDMWLSDFGGALLGAVVALSVALVVVWFDRRARHEERRTALAIEFMNSIDGAIAALDPDGGEEELRKAGVHLMLWGARMAAIFGHSRKHRRYAEWIHYKVDDATGALIAIRHGENTTEADIREKILAAVDALTSIQGATANWIMLSPCEWHPGDDSDSDIPRRWGCLARQRVRTIFRRQREDLPGYKHLADRT